METRWPPNVSRGTEVTYYHHKRAGEEVYDEIGAVVCYARLCELGYDNVTRTTQWYGEQVSRAAAERAAKFAARACAAALGCVLSPRSLRYNIDDSQK